MTTNNNLNPLPWYNSPDEQDWRKWYAHENKYPLLMPTYNLLPFQIRREARTQGIESVVLCSICGEECMDITDAVLSSGLQIVKKNVGKKYPYDLIINYMSLPMPVRMPADAFFYAKITDGVQTWYSEVFRTVNKIDRFIKLEYWNATDLCDVSGNVVMHYDGKYRNMLYIQAQVGKPGYEFNEVGEELDGVIVIEKQTSKKTYKFTNHAPEYLADALQGICLADYVYVTADSKEYRSIRFLSTPKWQEDGHYAIIDNEFNTADIFKNIANYAAGEFDAITFYANINDGANPIYGADVDMYIGTKPFAHMKSNESGYASYIKRMGRSEYDELFADQKTAIYIPNGVGGYRGSPELLFTGDRTTELLFEISEITTTRQDILSMRDANGEIIYDISVINDLLNIYSIDEGVGSIAISDETPIHIFIRMSYEAIVVDVRVNGVWCRQALRNDAGTLTPYTYNLGNPSSPTSIYGRFFILREFNSWLTDDDCVMLDNNSFPRLNKISGDLYSKCVAEFTADNAPDLPASPWVSSMGAAKLTPSEYTYIVIEKQRPTITFLANKNTISGHNFVTAPSYDTAVSTGIGTSFKTIDRADFSAYVDRMVVDGASIDSDALHLSYEELPELVLNEARLTILPGQGKLNTVYARMRNTNEVMAVGFYRGTTGTYIKTDNNHTFMNMLVAPAHMPRTDWLHYGKVCLLLEKGSTNLLANSKFPTGASIDQNEWLNYFNTAGALLYSDTFNTSLYLNSNVVLDNTYAFSAFAQRADKGSITVGNASTNDFQLIMAGAAGGGGATTLTPIYIKNGIFKIKGHRTATTAGSLASGVLKIPSQIAVSSLLTGYQLELGNLATTYIPTEGTTQTRVTESLTLDISKTGSVAVRTVSGATLVRSVFAGDKLDVGGMVRNEYGGVQYVAVFDRVVDPSELEQA